MHHFFVEKEDIKDDIAVIKGKDVNHISNVLRMKIGDELLVSSNDSLDYICIIDDIKKEEIILKIVSENENIRELGANIVLFQSLPKLDKMELIIQKSVELGVDKIVPVSTKRSVVKLDDKKEKQKIARWQEIAKSAAKQSKRGLIPEVSPVLSLNEAIEAVKDFDIKLIPYELETNFNNTISTINNIKKDEQIAIFIGPEGGFEESEVKKCKENGFLSISLGRRILRTETAGLTILANIMFHLESLNE